MNVVNFDDELLRLCEAKLKSMSSADQIASIEKLIAQPDYPADRRDAVKKIIAQHRQWMKSSAYRAAVARSDAKRFDK